MPLSGSHVISGRRKERANALLGLGTLAGALALAARGAFTAGVSGSEREIGVSLYYYFFFIYLTSERFCAAFRQPCHIRPAQRTC